MGIAHAPGLSVCVQPQQQQPVLAPDSAARATAPNLATLAEEANTIAMAVVMKRPEQQPSFACRGSCLAAGSGGTDSAGASMVTAADESLRTAAVSSDVACAMYAIADAHVVDRGGPRDTSQGGTAIPPESSLGNTALAHLEDDGCSRVARSLFPWEMEAARQEAADAAEAARRASTASSLRQLLRERRQANEGRPSTSQSLVRQPPQPQHHQLREREVGGIQEPYESTVAGSRLDTLPSASSAHRRASTAGDSITVEWIATGTAFLPQVTHTRNTPILQQQPRNPNILRQSDALRPLSIACSPRGGGSSSGGAAYFLAMLDLKTLLLAPSRAPDAARMVRYDLCLLRIISVQI